MMPIIINGKEETANILNGKPFIVVFYCIANLDIEYCYTSLYTDPLSFKIETQNTVREFLRSKKIHGTITVQWYPIVMGAVVSCKDNVATVVLKECCFNCNAEEKNELDLIMHSDGNKYCCNCLKSF